MALGSGERVSCTTIHTKLMDIQVQIPTEIFDEMGPVEEDPKWKPLIKFQECEPAQCIFP